MRWQQFFYLWVSVASLFVAPLTIAETGSTQILTIDESKLVSRGDLSMTSRRRAVKKVCQWETAGWGVWSGPRHRP